jgi:hypothetical protein
MWYLALSRMVGTIAVMSAPVVGAAAAFWWRDELAGVVRRWLA